MSIDPDVAVAHEMESAAEIIILARKDHDESEVEVLGEEIDLDEVVAEIAEGHVQERAGTGNAVQDKEERRNKYSQSELRLAKLATFT